MRMNVEHVAAQNIIFLAPATVSALAIENIRVRDGKWGIIRTFFILSFHSFRDFSLPFPIALGLVSFILFSLTHIYTHAHAHQFNYTFYLRSLQHLPLSLYIIDIYVYMDMYVCYRRGGGRCTMKRSFVSSFLTIYHHPDVLLKSKLRGKVSPTVSLY